MNRSKYLLARIMHTYQLWCAIEVINFLVILVYTYIYKSTVLLPRIYELCVCGIVLFNIGAQSAAILRTLYAITVTKIYVSLCAEFSRIVGNRYVLCLPTASLPFSWLASSCLVFISFWKEPKTKVLLFG